MSNFRERLAAFAYLTIIRKGRDRRGYIIQTIYVKFDKNNKKYVFFMFIAITSKIRPG
jgi:uncharacterized protein YccT (UPF0319 family)